MTHKNFQTEVRQLLDLVIHSLYTNRDIFLRELISNASDAVDRARFEALSNPALLEDDSDWKIKITPDKEARTLTISDNGTGMTTEEVERNIGTIAGSGTRRFLQELREHEGSLPPELIGQFGVGFYSAFMVADRVTVVTRPAGAKAEAATRWESEGTGGYTIETGHRDGRGTDVILHLKEGMDEYLDEWKIRKVVKTYSDFVEHPVVMDVAREKPADETAEGEEAKTEKVVEEETLNSRKAIWARPRNEVTQEEYNQFYRHVSRDFQDPLETIHWNVEGVTEFRALLYIPAKALYDVFMPEGKRGVQLYVRKVFITEECEALVPQYLRFLRGVVESSDLPLNVSRETLQEDRKLRMIRNNLVKKVLDTLDTMREKQRDRYVTFWQEFGRVLKEGVHLDMANREKLEPLLLFESSGLEAGTLTSLQEYVARMPDSQKTIYYITGESRDAIENSPHLEAFRTRGYEVLFMTDPIDEWVVQAMTEFDKKPLACVTKGDIDLESEEEKKEKDEQHKAAQTEFEPLVEAMKKALGNKVKDVRLSRRLTESACCLVTDEHGMGVQMEKIMKAFHREMPETRRILELNPAHPLLENLRALAAKNTDEESLKTYAELLYDQATLTAGLPLQDPLQFSRRVSDLMAAQTKAQTE